jgi:hypothetical protein
MAPEVRPLGPIFMPDGNVMVNISLANHLNFRADTGTDRLERPT